MPPYSPNIPDWMSYRSALGQEKYPPHDPTDLIDMRYHAMGVRTPAMIVDVSLMNSNIHKMMSKIIPTGVKVRPHLKASKCAFLAYQMTAAGATGGCVATISELEALVAEGFDDLLITSPVVGSTPITKLLDLIDSPSRNSMPRRDKVRIVIDDEANASHIAQQAFLIAADPIPVLIDLDVGLHRTGVQPGEPALSLARHIASLPQLRLIGIQGYDGHVQHIRDPKEREQKCLESMEILTSTADMLRENGFNIEVVTAGGTGTAEICAAVPGITEVQPGSFIFMDTHYRDVLGRYSYANALTVLTTVISKQGPRRVTIDAGLKALTTENGLAECMDARYKHTNLGDEHGCLTWEEGTPDLKVGDTVEMIPSHIGPTVNLHDRFWVYDSDCWLMDDWPVVGKTNSESWIKPLEPWSLRL